MSKHLRAAPKMEFTYNRRRPVIDVHQAARDPHGGAGASESPVSRQDCHEEFTNVCLPVALRVLGVPVPISRSGPHAGAG
eukprot:10977696-Karenia_brevis.AAC.1